MMNRLRVILPSDSKVIAVFLIFVVAEGPFVFLEWKIQQPLDIPRPGLFVLRFIGFIYGYWRLSSFHPALNPAYREWLERGPWNSRKALPAGPITLVWEDALPLGALAVMGAFLGPLIPYQAIALFLLGYLTALVSPLFSTAPKAFGYLILFGIGLGIRFWPDPEVMLATLVVVYLIGLIGLRIGLKRFPWESFADSPRIEDIQKQLQDNSFGWPFDQLKPPPDQPGRRQLTKFNGLMIGLLAGWFLFCFESLWPDPTAKLFLVQKGFTGAVGALAVGRTLIYCTGYASPISLMGRIRTFRWIIRGYDKVFLGPLCTILVGVLAIDRFRPPGLDDLIFLPMALAAAVTVALDTGPSLRTWQLTGQHRLTGSGSKMGGDFVKVG
jgi:hypothetical protein